MLRHFARPLRGTPADGGRWLNAAIAWKIHMRDMLILAAVELVLVTTAVVLVIVTV
jgi:hypothetical protein